MGTTLSNEVRETVEGITPYLHDNLLDVIIWRGDNRGSYSVKSAYLWLLDNKQIAKETEFAWIWKLDVPEKVAVFLWLLARRALPVNKLRWERGMSDSAFCHRCNLNVEDWHHALISCPQSRNVWDRLRVTWEQDGISDVNNWLRQNMEAVEGRSKLVALWGMWKIRCTESFSRTNMVLDNKERDISRDVTVIASMVSLKVGKNPILVRWNDGRDSPYIINTDGSFWPNLNAAGFGVVIRRDDGSWITAVSGGLRKASVLLAELHAIKVAAELAYNMGLPKVTCFSDSMEAIRCVKNADEDFHPLAGLIYQIRSLSRLHGNFEIKHSLREANEVADWMAKFGASSGSCQVTTWTEPPVEVQRFLSMDAYRQPYLRL